jgi:mRNA interferase HicA
MFSGFDFSRRSLVGEGGTTDCTLAMLENGGDVTASELRRKLAKLGCTFEQGRRHTIAIYKGKTSPIPRHPAREIKTGTYRKILKDLGLEGE